jgi:protein-disulfide isomerase
LELDLKNTTELTRRQRRDLARRDLARSQEAARRFPVWRQPIVLITAAAVVIGLAVVVAANLGAPQAAVPTGTALVQPPNSLPSGAADGSSLGAKNAPVQIQIYSDYQCPICGRLAREYLPGLIRDFVPQGQVRIEDRAIAFLGTGDPDESLDAAAAAECAIPQNRYWQFHDLLFWNQAGENKGAFNRDRLKAMAASAGLDLATWQSCFDGSTVRTNIEQATSAALKAGINATPTIIINGQAIRGLPQSYDSLAAYVRQLLASQAPVASQSQ